MRSRRGSIRLGHGSHCRRGRSETDPHGRRTRRRSRARQRDVAHQRTGLQVQLKAEDNPSLPGPVATALFRVVQEALTNVIQHSSATNISVRARFDGHELALTFSDDGRGICHDAVAGKGLVNMRSRAAALGGEFNIEATGAGTTIVLRLPSHEAVEMPVAALSAQ